MAKNPARGQNINPKNAIPNLVGMTRTTAQALLSSLGFTYSESSTSTSNAGQDNIISSQAVTAGNTELLGTQVPYVYQTFSFSPFGFSPAPEPPPEPVFSFTPFGAFSFVTTPVFGFTPFGAFGFLQFSFVPSQCIEENTLVKTPNGDIPVKDLKMGDSIYSINIDEVNTNNSISLNSSTLTATGLVEVQIDDIYVSQKDIVVCFNEDYYSKYSQEQPFFIKRDGFYGVISAGLINEGDYLIKINEDGNTEESLVNNIEIFNGNFNVYSLSLSSQTWYVAGGCLVHTK
jgi:hypothetical protein